MVVAYDVNGGSHTLKTLLTNARIIDGAGTCLDRGWIMISGRHIIATGEGEPPRVEGSSAVLRDLAGATVLPGLIDCHVHLSLDGSADPMGVAAGMPDPVVMLHLAANAVRTLQSGFTTVRDLGGKNYTDVYLRDGIDSGLASGPRLVCAGRMICITGGHGWQMGHQADGPDSVRQAVRTQVRAGVDVIKFMATGGVLTRGGVPGIPQLTLEELKAGVEEAHKASRRTAAHCQGLEGAKNAVLAGIDSIEHGVGLDDDLIELMVHNRVFLVPTLSAPTNILAGGILAGIPDEYVRKTERVKDDHLASLSLARKAGVKIAMGTDAGTPFNLHGRNAGELVLMVEHGFSPMEALVSATGAAAELLDLRGKVGTISKNAQADLLIVDGNPLEDISILTDPKRILTVVKGGVPVTGALEPGA